MRCWRLSLEPRQTAAPGGGRGGGAAAALLLGAATAGGARANQKRASACKTLATRAAPPLHLRPLSHAPVPAPPQRRRCLLGSWRCCYCRAELQRRDVLRGGPLAAAAAVAVLCLMKTKRMKPTVAATATARRTTPTTTADAAGAGTATAATGLPVRQSLPGASLRRRCVRLHQRRAACCVEPAATCLSCGPRKRKPLAASRPRWLLPARLSTPACKQWLQL